MNGNRTYRHNDADGNFIRWMTEVQGDKFSSHSRPATEEEIFAGERAEARAASVAKFNAELDAQGLKPEVPVPVDPDVEAAEKALAEKAVADKANDAVIKGKKAK